MTEKKQLVIKAKKLRIRKKKKEEEKVDGWRN